MLRPLAPRSNACPNRARSSGLMPKRANSLIRHLAESANGEAEMIAAQLRADCVNDACDLHVDEVSVITVTAQWDGHATVQCSDFCCDHFKNKYQGLEARADEPDEVVVEVIRDPSQTWLWPPSSVRVPHHPLHWR